MGYAILPKIELIFGAVLLEHDANLSDNFQPRK